MGLELLSEIDLVNLSELADALTAKAGSDHDVVVEAKGLEFIDVKACRKLVEFAEALANGWRLIINSPPAVLMRVMTVCGFDQSRKIVLTGEGS